MRYLQHKNHKKPPVGPWVALEMPVVTSLGNELYRHLDTQLFFNLIRLMRTKDALSAKT